MRHLKRFRNWLGFIYCAAWALNQQAKKNQYRIYERESVGPTTGPKPVMTLLKKVATVPKPSNPSAFVARPGPYRLTAPARVKPRSPNGSASAPRPLGGKYDPSAINDQTAERLARLLVSEIKLYYLSTTNGAGAVGNNIYDMLKDPIDKSRQHYKQRMGATAVETMPDYFHGELVRSLCAGDASRLGPNYRALNERS